jgi:2-dehydropantoate 2-reductase
MKILVFGAGVLGSLYAARLQDAGHDVSILARGQRLVDIEQHGIVLEDAATGRRTATRVQVVETLAPEDAYHLVLVTVRKNQLDSVLPLLAGNRCTPNVLFMFNNAAGPEDLVDALGYDRVLLGFPGAGGMRDGRVIRYSLVPGLIQPATLGELSGHITPRLRAIGGVFHAAGFPVALSRNMDAWLKTHVALVSPIANAVYLAGGDNYRLANTRDGLILMCRAIREGFAALRALGVPITPARLRILNWLPEPILVAIMRRVLNTHWAELVIARHANAARDEMEQLADEFAVLALSTEVSTLALDQLYIHLDPAVLPVPEGSRELSLDWTHLWAWIGLVVGLIAFGMRFTRRQSG